MKPIFALLICLVAFPLLAQKSIYNDDPFQKMPLGMEHAEYHYRQPTGDHFSGARIEPPNWWVGMANPEVEVLLYDRNIAQLTARVEAAAVSVTKVTRLANPNYLFVTLAIAENAGAQQITIELLNDAGTKVKSYPYDLQSRTTDAKAQGIDASDFIYLIMPDRFANGDRGNDKVKGMTSTDVNREKFFFRHGGDLIGVMEHLDYLEELGATALWLNPVLENDQPYESYHGYAVTDHYRIDRRFGSNEQYRQLIRLAHERGQKVIMDVIFNHTGDHHWFIQDIPSEDWIHQWSEGLQPISYRAPVHMDPYGAQSDFEQVVNSWFDKHMPDLNQQQPQLANYLIQNSIWWTEYSGQDGFRIDTYAYCDQTFMAEWNRRMLAEYPDIGIFAETWVHGAGIQAWFPEGERADSHNSNLPGVTDFQMYYALNEALSREQGWTDGVARIYYTLAKDYLYANPYNNVLFLDNHDLGRIYGNLGEDLTKFKSAMALLLTMRGVPMLYYGTEILMTGTGGTFGEGGRKDFPGGFRKDKENKFRAKDRTPEEQEAFRYISTLANYRKENSALQDGQLTQYIPENGVYVYFRHNEEKTLMVVYNSNAATQELPTARFTDHLGDAKSATEIATGKTLEELTTLSVPGHTTWVLELRE
ncbi:MAG: glycoside hydrolase family 13 protein [Bacteroidota bacterium]